MLTDADVSALPHLSGFTPVFPVLTPAVEATFFIGRFPIFHPQLRKVLTTFGVTAAVKGTLMKMKDLCIA